MINGIYKIFKSNNPTIQLPDNVLDAIVSLVKVTLVIGFVLGVVCMAVVHKIMG